MVKSKGLQKTHYKLDIKRMQITLFNILLQKKNIYFLKQFNVLGMFTNGLANQL